MIPALDPFDLIKRLSSVPMGPLVDTLRQIHHRGSPDAEDLRRLMAAPDTSRAPEAQVTSPSANGSSADGYETARQHFVRHSERLREQAMLAERLLDRLSASKAALPPLRQELHIDCAPGGRSEAPFVVANGLRDAADVHFRPGRVHGLPHGTEPFAVRFDPERIRLEPGAERTVQLSLELPRTEQLPAQLECGVDVLGGEHVLLKLWIQVHVVAEGLHARQQ